MKKNERLDRLFSSRYVNHYSLIIVLLSGAVISACGYYNPYVIHDENSIPSISLYLDIWPNRTNELGLESKFFRSQKSWFKRSKKIHTTQSKDKADLLLEGEIVSIQFPGLSYGLFDQAVEVKAVVTVRYSMRDRKEGKILWEVPSQVFEEAVSVAPETTVMRGNKKKALDRISDDLAETIYLRTLETLSSFR